MIPAQHDVEPLEARPTGPDASRVAGRRPAEVMGVESLEVDQFTIRPGARTLPGK